MKRFIKNTLTTIIISAAMLIVITWLSTRQFVNADFTLDQDTRTIVLGPSTTGCALDDRIIDGFQNISKDATTLDLMVSILPRILDENPQIDTVWINHGRFLFKHTGEGGKEGMQSLRDKMFLIFYDFRKIEWKNYLSNENFYCAVLNPRLSQMFLFPHKKLSRFDFGYREIIGNNLQNSSVTWSTHWYDSLSTVHGGNVYTKEWILENCKSSDYGAREAIRICQEKKVVPVLFFTPLYHFDNWCTVDGYRDYLTDYDPDLLVADYEDFEFPNDTMYGDVHHLNKWGAQYFSKYLNDNGLRTETVAEWISRHQP